MNLTSICDIQMGYTAKRGLELAAWGGVPVIQLRDFSENGGIDSAALMAAQVEDASDRYFVGKGDVLFRSRGTRNTAAALDVHFSGRALAVSPVVVLRPQAEVILPEYLAWAINQPDAQRHFDTVARGSSMRMIPKSGLTSLTIDVPSLLTQKKIVEAAALAQRERELAVKLADKRYAYASARLAEIAELNKNKSLGGKHDH